MKWTKEKSLLAHKAKEKIRLNTPINHFNKPEKEKPLYTIRIESHIENLSFEIKVKQGKRLNQIIAETFGCKSKSHGMDWLMKNLRKKLVVRWSHD